MSKIWIKNCILVPMVKSLADSGDLYYRGEIAIEDNKLKLVGPVGTVNSNWQADIIIDGTNLVALPGFINTHTHAAMTLLRSYADDLPLMQWLEQKIWPLEAKMTGEDIYWGTQLCILEMLLSGTTTFVDMYDFMPQVAKAVEETGIRACLARGVIGTGENAERGLIESENFIQNWHGKANGRIITMLGPHAPYTCPPDYLRKIIKLAEKLQVGIHIHVAETEGEIATIGQEYGKTPVALLADIGLFDYPTLAAHCVYVNEEDIAILKKKNVGVAHNPESNMKLGSGIAPVPAMLKAGIPVALGTDGASSNNNLDMLEEMRTAALLHKVNTKDPTVITSYQALEMATKNGAAALGLQDKIGMLKPGMLADVILFNINKPHLYPRHDILAHLVYSAQSSDIDTVIVDGKILVQNGTAKNFAVEQICAEIETRAMALAGKPLNR
ncbi:amidohydrolase [Bacillota bacterium LX-D]|nr:amidohydrolase [Bacillota bacterium LX-D]